ncbi:MAG TPA: protein phosphatase 2C domain-containing protein [Candidatus Competibacteraceae bacterium]|nr:MAG: hypothetical protein EKK71_08635 [Candidatus Competibacteraceae bacterium]HOB61032.1 protein phosphatase 2C domain-containing protein [Candidatus Competibacteraceae bacterium]HQA25816.1 protein phosphatase 2C domain-containing protein [Candidatus Competibacteraceae bacterium]HQD55831.1 protein phosphatase 2C domain-containing protein [Candidatus Competibacteraceae bacterium]
MTVALDSHFTIGKLHLCCQDYVYQGWAGFPYVILADGCSSAPDSDVGARLLALNARRLLPQFALAARDEAERHARHWRLGRRIVRRAARQVRDLGMNLSILDATLLVAWCDGVTVYVHLYGDGCLAVRRLDGGVAAIEVEYAGNAPYYLSYQLDPERQDLYRDSIEAPASAQRIHYLSDSGITTRRERFDAPTVFSFSLAALPTVAVATDGLRSFVDIELSERMNLLVMARALLDFLDTDGAFVKHQLRQVVADYGRRNIFNLDDLSMGVFVKMDNAVG